MRLRLTILLCLSATRLIAAEPTAMADAKKHLREKNYAAAEAALEALLAADPANAETLYWLGWTELQVHDYPGAVKHLERAVALKPTEARYHHTLGDAYGLSARAASVFSKLGLAKKCLAAYSKAVELDPDHLPYRRSRYEFYTEAPGIAGGGKDKAMAELAEIEKRHPVQGALIRVDLLIKEEKSAEALEVLKALQGTYPDNKSVAYQIGRVVAITGHNLDAGAAALRDYLNHTPQQGEAPHWAAHWRLGMIEEKQGNTDGARSHYEEALKLNSACEPAREALKRLAP